MKHWLWFHLSSKLQCHNCKLLCSCLAWRIYPHLAWIYLIWTSSLHLNVLKWRNLQTNARMMILSTLLKNVETLWVWANLFLSLMIPRQSCTIYFRKSLSIRALTSHEATMLTKEVKILAEGAIRRMKQIKTEHQNKRTLISHKLSFEVADAPITWITWWLSSAEDWKLSCLS